MTEVEGVSTKEREDDLFTISPKTTLPLVSRGERLTRKAGRAYGSFLRSDLVAYVDAERGAVS